MLTILAYLLVIPLVPVAMTIGVVVGGFPVALALAWTTVGVRTKIAGVVCGVLGVAAAVGFGLVVFRWLVGPGSYTLWPFLATIIPLGIPIANDFSQAKRVKLARDEMLGQVEESRPGGSAKLAAWSKTSHTSAAIGELIGIAMACVWFLVG